MTIPFGNFSAGLSPQMQQYERESHRAGMQALQQLRAMAGIQSEPLPMIDYNTSSVRDMSHAVTGVAPASLPSPMLDVMQRNPRDGREFNLFDPSRVMRSYGPTRYIEEEPLMTQPPTQTIEQPAVGDAVPERTWQDKLRRALNATSISGGPLGGIGQTEEERRAQDAERQQMYAGIAESLVNSVDDIASFMLESPVTVPQTGSAVEKLQTGQRVYRLEAAQAAMNYIDAFKRSAASAAAKEGVSEADIEEAKTWGGNTGIGIGYIPLAGAVELGVASRMAAFTTGIGARGILASPLLRHFVGGAAANMTIMPNGTPLLPQGEIGADGFVDGLEDVFLTPNYVGAGLLGGSLSAAAAWFMPKVFSGFGFKQGYQGNRNLPVIYDDTRGFHRQQAPGPRDPNLGIPEAEYEIVRDAAAPRTVDVLDEGYIFGERMTGPVSNGPFYSGTPDNARPIAGLLTDGSEKIGQVGDLDILFPPAARDVSVAPFVDASVDDVIVDPFRDRAVDSWVDVGVDAVWMPPKPRVRKAVVKVEGVPGPSLFPPEPLTGPISTMFDTPYAPAESLAPAPSGIDFSFGGLLDNVVPDTNAPVLLPSAELIPSIAPTASVPVADQSPTLFAPASIEQSVPSALDLNQPITLEERLVDAGLEPESAALITVDEEATVPAARMRMPDQVLMGRDIAEAFGSDYTNAQGKPMLVYGVGDYSQVKKMSENGMQELFAGRGVVYATTSPESAGGSMQQQYMQQELAGQLYPAPTGELQATPNVTNAARQAAIAIEQTEAKIGRMKRELARMPEEGSRADSLRQQINAAEQKLEQHRIPSSAVTPMYVVSRRHLDLNAPIRRGIREELIPSERTQTEDIMVAAMESLMRLYPKTADRVMKNIMPAIDAGTFDKPQGAQLLYNAITFKATQLADNFKGAMFNKALQSVGVDSMHYTTVGGVSQGNSQINRMGADVVMVLDPRALVPAYAADAVIARDVAALQAVDMSKAAAVVADPARPDLPEIKNISDIDYIDTQIIVNQNEHVMVKNPANAPELMRDARRQYPLLYVQAVDAPGGRTHVYVGAKPMTPKQQESYRESGYYANQEVKDVKNGGIVRRIQSVLLDEDTGQWTMGLYPLKGQTGIRPIGITAGVRERFLPGTTAAPVIEFGGRELWNEFTNFASAYMAVTNSEGKSAVTSMIDSDARAMMPEILPLWFESKGIDNVLQRKAITAIFDQELVKLYEGTAPDGVGFYKAMRDSYLEFTDGVQTPPSLHELASIRGMTAQYVRGGSEIILRSGTSTAETLLFDSQPAAREYLHNLEPVENEISTGGEIPPEVAPYPAHDNVPMGQAGPIDPTPLTVEGNEAAINTMIDDELPLTREMAEEHGEGLVGEEQEFIPVMGASGGGGPTFTGGTQVPTKLSNMAEFGQIVLNKSLGWFQPNHTMFANMEQLFYNIVDKQGNRPFSMLRPYQDMQVLKRQQAIALERGNPAYKALERARRAADYAPLINGDTFRVFALKDPAARLAYVTKNDLPLSVLTTVDQLEEVADLIFETPAQRKAHLDNILTFVENVGFEQTGNRVAQKPINQDIYARAAQGLSNIDWFVNSARQNHMMMETVNAIDLLNRVAHSYNYSRFVEAQAKVVEDQWNKIGQIKIPTQSGSDPAQPFEPFVQEVRRMLDIFRTGQDSSMANLDVAPKAFAKMVNAITLGKFGMTVGESKRFLATATSNAAKSYLGWAISPVLRDFPQMMYTMAPLGPGPVISAMKDFITPGVRGSAFTELRRLGLASTENELQSSAPFIQGDIGSGELYSTFTPEQQASRQRLEAAYVNFMDKLPARVRELGAVGMHAYLKSNSLSRAVTGWASVKHFRAEIAKRGMDKMSPAQLTNIMVNQPEVFSRLMDDLGVTLEPTARLIRDMMTQGRPDEALMEYGQHIMALTQGMYGPLHTGKLWRIQSGRMGGMFQNYGMFQIDMAAQVAGRGPATRKDMSARARAGLVVRFLAVAGGTAYAFKELKERTGFDMTGWAYWSTASSRLPLASGPIIDAVTGTIKNVNNVLSQTGDYPSRQGPTNRGLTDLGFNAMVPLARPLGKAFDLFGDAMNSERPQNEILQFMLNGRSGVNSVDMRRQGTERLNEAEQLLRDLQQQGNGAQ